MEPTKLWHSHAARHGCCCWHVVNHFEAMPGPEVVILGVARDKLANCPHADVRTELELYVEMLRDMSVDADLTGVDGSGEASSSASAAPDLTVGSVGAQVGPAA